MITRYIIVNMETKTVHPEGFMNQKDAWKKCVELSYSFISSPYDWDIIEIEFPIN